MDILETDAYDRRQRRNTSCVLLFSLLPFFLATAVFFYLRMPDSSPSVLRAGMTAAPVVLLAVVVLGWNGAPSILGVAGGLVFSAVGDCCLVWPEFFIHGMAAFATAHLLYSLTFLSARYSTSSGSSCCSHLLYLLLLLGGGGVYVQLYPFLQKAPDPTVLTPAVGVYVGLIVLMASLAIRTRKAVTVLGSLTFMVSDLVLSLQVFKVIEPLEHGNTVAIATYYLAQLLITVGDVKAVEYKSDFGKWKRS